MGLQFFGDKMFATQNYFTIARVDFRRLLIHFLALCAAKAILLVCKSVELSAFCIFAFGIFSPSGVWVAL